MKEVKKSWYKRWWAIVLYILIGLIIIGTLFGNNNSPDDFCKSLIPERINLVNWANENGVQIWSYHGSKFEPLVNETPVWTDGATIEPLTALWFQKGYRTNENINYLYGSSYLKYEKEQISPDGTIGEKLSYRIMIVLDPNDKTTQGYKIKYYKCCQSTKYNPCDILGFSYQNR